MLFQKVIRNSSQRKCLLALPCGLLVILHIRIITHTYILGQIISNKEKRGEGSEFRGKYCLLKDDEEESLAKVVSYQNESQKGQQY